MRVTDTVAGQASTVQDAIFCCERECRTRMREIFPFAGIAVFQIDEEGTRGPDLITLAKRCNRWGLVAGGVARERSTVVRGLFMVAAPT